jgi:signal transduction histidine kinase
MEITSPTVVRGQTGITPVVGRLVWSVSILSILIAIVSLGLAAYQASISGKYELLITHQTLTPLITIGLTTVGALVFSRQPRHPVGWIFLTVGVLYALVGLTAALTMISPTGSELYVKAKWFGSWLWLPAVFLPVTIVPLLYPNGRVPSPRWQFAAWTAGCGIALVIPAVMLHPGPLVSLGLEANPFGIPAAAPVLDWILTLGSTFLAIGVIGSMAALLVRFRHSTGVEREQMKWLVYAMGLFVLMSGLTSTFAWLYPDIQWGMQLGILVSNLGILGIAIAAAVAILRYRLYDIDLIIQRTLVYGALMVGITAFYGLIVGTLGAIFQARSNFLVSLMASALVAILVQPMRDGLQRLVSRLLYGERDDPYTVMTSLSRRLKGSLSPEAALPAAVETIAQALKLPCVAIALKQEGGFETAASYGISGESPIQLPLIYQGEMIGQIRLSQRAPDEPFTPGEQRLLNDIAGHIGVTAHNVLLTRDLRRLAEDLQRSREELVKGREEERRRLRRDLHDELGPQLASLKLNLDVARNLVSRDPRAAEALLVELRSQSQSAIADIRRLVFDLRPPALDELGLIGAIHEYTRQIVSQDGLHIRVDTPRDLPPLPAAVEVAAYRITLEALANFVRHSQGSSCQVTVTMTGDDLQVEVCDDGLGLPKDVQPGVGLNSMRERAAELGGTCVIETLPVKGTRVVARLPLG